MRPSDQRTGQLLGGKYRLHELLALGGMGIVYAARHQATGRSVAIKLLRPELLTNPDLVRRVSAEARLAVEAAHPNVVEVIDAGADDDGVPYLVLERLYGHTLEALLSAPLPLLATAQALVPVMNALGSLHRAGIVHRDIKPSNIFLHSDGDARVTPKLLDFGIAKAVESDGSTLSGVALGTPAYMAPEQALGCGEVGPATDVWSMAVVFARCLTGTLPFAGNALHPLSPLRSGLRPADLVGAPEPVAAVLTSALQLEPLARPASIVEFRTQLLEALNRVDPALAWPDASSVNYPSSQSALASALAEACQASSRATSWGMREDSADERVRARPQHVQTRTLTRLPRRLPAAGKHTGARRVALVTAGVAILATLSYSSVDLERWASEVEPAPALAPSAVRYSLTAVESTGDGTPALAPTTTPAIDVTGSGDEQAKESEPPGLAPSGARHERAAKRAARAPEGSAPDDSTPKQVSVESLVVAREHDAIRQLPDAPTSPQEIGANRAPIID